MPTPIREQVLAAFHTAIDTALSVDVERNRSREIPVDSTSYVVLLDGQQYIASDETGLIFYTMTVTVEGYSRAATDALVGPAVNALYADVVAAAVADHTLGGLSVDVREGDLPDVYIDPEASKPTMAFALDFEIDYFTKETDPYTIGP